MVIWLKPEEQCPWPYIDRWAWDEEEGDWFPDAEGYASADSADTPQSEARQEKVRRALIGALPDVPNEFGWAATFHGPEAHMLTGKYRCLAKAYKYHLGGKRRVATMPPKPERKP